MIEYVKEYLKMNDVEYKENTSLALMSTVRIGGWARLVAFPDTANQMAELLHFLEKSEIEYKVVGRMSNILPCDNDYCKVIVNTNNLRGFDLDEGFISVNVGEYVPALVARLAAMGVGGIEQLSGIPGSIGGLISNNAGAYGLEIGDLVLSGYVFDRAERRVRLWQHADFDFSYRSSAIRQEKAILLSARIKVMNEAPSLIRDKIANYKQLRLQKQPLDLPSLGSVFKSPSGMYSSRLIDECSLKGTTVGAAQVSTKHSGFIVNLGGATARDYKSLVNVIISTVKEKRGVTLEREIEYLE